MRKLVLIVGSIYSRLVDIRGEYPRGANFLQEGDKGKEGNMTGRVGRYRILMW